MNTIFESLLMWLDMESERRSPNCKLDALITVPASPGKATSQFNEWLEISVQATAAASPKIIS